LVPSFQASRVCTPSAYDAGDHWHFVTLGLTELWAKGHDRRPDVSGYGFEFTMRTRQAESEEPPVWVLNLLNRLADVTFQGHELRPGDTLDPGRPIDGEPASVLRALAFAVDPLLGAISTPNGKVEFVQVLGITREELAAIKADRSALSQIESENPLLITDPDR
jgi:hypothetical protein